MSLFLRFAVPNEHEKGILKREMKDSSMNIAVIFAGGVGQRMHSVERPKQFLEMNNKPIIIHTLEHFEKHPQIDAIVIACVEEYIPYLKELLYKHRIEKVKKIVSGGKTGQMSIYNGLCAAKEISSDDNSIVLIHDGVRPLINDDVITRNIESVKKKWLCNNNVSCTRNHSCGHRSIRIY